MRIFPSGWIEIARTELFAPEDELNVSSSEPSVFNLAIRCRWVPEHEVKAPPINIFPSGWIAIEETVLFAPKDELNDVSSEPSVFNLAIRCRWVPEYEVKAPPINIFPSDWIEIALTKG